MLNAHGFPAGTVHFRANGESYADVASRVGADVLVEDDCESIGGAPQTTAAALGQSGDHVLSCVVVPEFGGLAHLPDDPRSLAEQPLPRAIPYPNFLLPLRASTDTTDRAALAMSRSDNSLGHGY